MLLKSQSASTNWEELGFIRYLTRQTPANESGETLVYDENVKRNSSRPYTWNRCLKTNTGGTDGIYLEEAGISGGYTIMFWAKMCSLSQAYLIQKRNAGTAPTEGYYIYYSTGGNVNIGFLNNTIGGFSDRHKNVGTGWLVTDEWHLYGITFSGSGLRDITFFRDGVEIASVTMGVDYIPCTLGQTVTIARDSYGTANAYWKWVGQWTTSALSVSEQLAIYNGEDYTPSKEYLFENDEEGGSSTLIVSTDGGTTGTIITSNITAMRAEQDDVPLLKNSFDIVGCIVCDEGTVPLDYAGTKTNPTTHTGRKDFPLTPKNEPCWVFPNTTDYIQSPSSLTGVTITDLKGSGDYTTSDFSVDTVNDRIKASTSNAYFVEMTLSNGIVLVFTGNPTNDSDKIYDITNEVIWTTNYADIANNQGTQDIYSHRLVYGFTVQDNGGDDEWVPNATDKTTLTLSGYSISETHHSGIYANDLISLNAPFWSRASLIGSSNMDFQRSKTDSNGNAIKDRTLVALRYSREDDYPAITLDYSAGDYIQGDVGENWTGVTITAYDGDPSYSTSDFSINTSTNRITATSADAQFAQLTLSNGNKYYHKGDGTSTIYNGKTGGNNATLVYSDLNFCETTQFYWNWEVEYNPASAINKIKKYTNND